ncbi:hypothetical protein BDN72DRAFT_838180 [Pluteus cervinus]|uniref:Uncharacterized protein n=1 Tax=Pluteus cervinus TaxID=181527 RepID=A0ACD3AZG4_9AGAR|nr:hypothetical protein BDN72DRAFT_838180 [Pluteus cervinus]
MSTRVLSKGAKLLFNFPELASTLRFENGSPRCTGRWHIQSPAIDLELDERPSGMQRRRLQEVGTSQLALFRRPQPGFVFPSPLLITWSTTYTMLPFQVHVSHLSFVLTLSPRHPIHE